MGTIASAQRLRVGAELRRLRLLSGLAGEQVAAALSEAQPTNSWSQSKVSRIETGRTAFTVKDVAGLLALYGVADDVRAELLASTAEDTGEGAWIVRAGGFPRRQTTIATMEHSTWRIRQYQPVLVPGLLQTREYALSIARAAGATNPEEIADARMRRQEVLSGPSASHFDVVIDARATLLRTASAEVACDQVLSLAERAKTPNVDLRIIPLGAQYKAISTVGFTIFDFRAEESPSVVWIESASGDVYFSAPEDVQRHEEMFEQLKAVALNRNKSIRYLRSLAGEVERFATNPEHGGSRHGSS